jgi:VanZ family protein
MSDVFANASGALAGAIGAVLLSTFVEGFLRSVSAAGVATVRSFFPLLVATVVLLAGKLEPFDVTLDVSSVIPKLRSFFADPMQFGVPIDEGISILQHLLFTSTLVVWLGEINVGHAAAVAAFVGVVVAIGAEAAQLVIGSRMPGLWDAGIGMAGALAGIPVGMSLRKSRKNPGWWAGVFVLTLIGVAMQQLSPFKPSDTVRPFQWIPFLNYYTFTTSETVSHSAELLLAYFPLGFVFALATRRRRKRYHVVLGAALMIAMPVEYLQQFVGGRFPDVTDIALSLAGAWLGAWTATKGWRLFDEQMALVTPSRPVPAAGPASR